MGIILNKGLTISQMAEKYGVTRACVNQYAIRNSIPFVSLDGVKVKYYLFDKAAEKAFANRPKQGEHLKSEYRTHKPPKEPGRRGRPRTRPEKPVYTGPKRPVGRPRKIEKDS